MERRRYPRIAVNLNVALLDEQSLPRGCRVRDVSQGGMLLQFERHSEDHSYTEGQSVQVRASLKDGDQRRVLLLPATVQRVEDKGIGVAFARPEAELMQLLEPYALDRDQRLAPAAEHAVSGGSVHAFPSSRPRHRHSLGNGGARLAERIAAAREAIASSGHLSSTAENPSPPAAARDGGTERRMLQLGLVSMAVAVVVIIFNLAAGSSTRQRLAALENATQHQAEALADVQIRLTADRDQERLARLDNRVNRLAVSVAALETGQLTPASEPDAPQAQKTPDVAAPHASPTASPPAPEPEPLAAAIPAAAPAPSASAGKRDGPWVINLASLYDKAAAERFTQKARTKGIEVEVDEARVQDRPVWRLQVSGFTSRDAAQAFSDANKGALGVRQVWIFKR